MYVIFFAKLDISGIFSDVGEEWFHLGYVLPELVGRSVLSLTTKKDHQLLAKTLGDLREQEGVREIQLSLVSKAKNVRPFVLNLRRKNNEMLLIATPVCQTYEASSDSSIISEKASQKRKRELTAITHWSEDELAIMVAGLSHQINNPLAIIASNVRKIEKSLGQNDVPRSLVCDSNQKILSMVDRIAHVVGDLKIFAQNSIGESIQMVSLLELIKNTSELAKDQLEANIRLALPSSCDPIFIKCQSSKISLALFNLIKNACEASAPLSDAGIELGCKVDGGFAYVEITDSGEKIATDIVAKIVTPFFTTKGNCQNRGLGLSVTYGIIRDHGGKLWLDGEHTNTRFIFSLPLAKDA